jgi:anti-anti-sigma factor
MQLQSELCQGVTVVRVKGRLDVHTSPHFLEEMKGWENRPTVLDMSELEYLSSAGLRALHLTRQALPALAVAGFNSFCQEIYTVAGFAALVPEYPRVEDAVAALAG